MGAQVLTDAEIAAFRARCPKITLTFRPEEMPEHEQGVFTRQVIKQIFNRRRAALERGEPAYWLENPKSKTGPAGQDSEAVKGR